jgi:hypothetical protein
MRSIGRFVYSVVLALSGLTFTPSPASAQEMHGSFTLSHEVRWQKYVVPAGDYRFEVQPKGPSAILQLRKVSGNSAGFLILANNAESSKPSDLDRLVVVARPSGSYVSSMELPEFGETLRFVVPSESAEVARATVISSDPSAQ